MKEKLIMFMQGRYGVDTFSKFLLVVGLVAVVLPSLLGSRTINTAGYILGWAVILYCYFRMFSKNVRKRYAENQVFLAKTAKIRAMIRSQKGIWNQRKTHHIYKCPGCGQKIRIPRGRGKIEVCCPKCSATFVKNS